jgi:hypothetical protein
MPRKRNRPSAKYRQLTFKDGAEARRQTAEASKAGWERSLFARLRSINPAALQVRPRRFNGICEVVFAVACLGYGKPGGECQESKEDILSEILARADKRKGPVVRKPHQLYEFIIAARELGLLDIDEYPTGDDGKRGPDIRRVSYARLDELVAQSVAYAENPKQAKTGQNRPKQAKTDRSSARGARALRNSPKGNSEFQSLFESKPSSSLPFRTTTSTGRARQTPEPNWLKREEEEFWNEAKKAVEDFGVKAADRAIRSVQNHNGTPDVVLAIVAFAATRRAAWSNPEGALYWRLTYWRPGQAVDQAWAKTNPGWRDPAADAAAQAAEKKQIAQMLARREEFLAARAARGTPP